MSSISITRVIDAVKNFVIRTEKIQEEMIISIFICCPHCDVFSSCVDCYINACIVGYITESGDENLCTVYVGTDSDFNSVMTYETEEDRAYNTNDFLGDKAYVYSTIQQASVLKFIDKETKQLVLNAIPNKKHFVKKTMRFSKPDRRRKQLYEPYYGYNRIEYYSLSLYYQDSDEAYSAALADVESSVEVSTYPLSLSDEEMEEIFNLLEE